MTNREGIGGFSPEMAESSRERREKEAHAVVERMRAEGYFRDGEDATFVRPAEGSGDAWLVRCDTDALLTPPGDPEWKKKFSAADPLEDAFVAAGFRVDVWPDYGNATATTFRVEYHLYEKKD